MKIEKYAAVDIGSNAIRVLISNVIKNEKGNIFFSKNALVRVPIRLGQDSFTSGNISNTNIKKLLDAIKAFKLIINLHNVVHFNVYATSAIREASNHSHVVQLIKNKTGIEIEVIDGKKEAKLISSLNLFQGLNKQSNFLYVDVGGGSSEFSIIQNGKRIEEKSFKIGTVRILNNLVSDLLWDEVKNWIIDKTKKFDSLLMLGTGGNINKIHKITETKDGEPISLLTIKNLHKKMSSITYNQRIIDYELNPDRADVILPALKIYIRTMQWGGVHKIFVPKIGLADGMIQELYKSNNNSNI
jgi:exopolyphosphatase/guanosine-5'-triphosphate,3'-diphosphate pyrophosphatase